MARQVYGFKPPRLARLVSSGGTKIRVIMKGILEADCEILTMLVLFWAKRSA